MDFENQSDLQVQKIMDKKVFNGKTLYLVKWKNYPLEQATWECNKILVNVKDKLREFKYSKRTTQDIPNIKIQEDMPEGQVRDTFKRKRGRPPRMTFNSYRQVANQPHKKGNEFQTNIGINEKRKRGRPRGSKNKKTRQIHCEEQSSASFDSEGLQNQKEIDKTLTNSDIEENRIEDYKMKKLKKLNKIKEKLKVSKKTLQSDSSEQFDIVDSESQVSEEKKFNFNSGKKQTHSKSDKNNPYQISQILKLDKNHSTQKDVEGKQDEKNTDKDENQVFKLLKQRSQHNLLQKNSQILTNLEKLQNTLSTKKSNEYSALQNEQSIYCSETKRINEKNKIIISNEKEDQRQLISKEDKTNERIQIYEREIGINQTKRDEPKRISKIYYLETIQIPTNFEFQINFESQFYSDSLSQQNLQRNWKIKHIVQQLNHPLFPSNKQNSIFNSRISQSDKITKSISQESKELKLFQQIHDIVKVNLSQDNQEIIKLILKQFPLDRGNSKTSEIQNKKNKFSKILQEPLYLVEFDQGKLIKKLISSQLILYLIIDWLKTASDQSIFHFTYQSLHNFIFYIQFLEKQKNREELKNQSKTKVETSSRRNIKIEENIQNKKQELQQMLLQAMKNIKNKTKGLRLTEKKSIKRKNQPNRFQGTNGNEQKVNQQLTELKSSEGNSLFLDNERGKINREEESSAEEANSN